MSQKDPSQKGEVMQSMHLEVQSSHSLQQPVTTRTRSVQSQLPATFQMMKNRDVLRLFDLKGQLIKIRQRKVHIKRVPDPQVVKHFGALKQTKNQLLQSQKLKVSIEQKKKELSKLKHLYTKSELQFEEKSQVFKQKSALLRVLGGKMQTQLTKTKQRYRQVEFNRVIVQGVRRVLYYRLTEIFFNQNAKNLYNAVNSLNNEQKQEDSLGNCLGYLTLFICLVGQICGARMWINFTFKGPRSTIKLTDGSVLTLHPRQPRINDGIRLLTEQLQQIMRDKMHLKVNLAYNFYHLCEELTREILSAK